ncbi:hypothetical protein YC2023_021893 [Brassica napus]
MAYGKCVGCCWSFQTPDGLILGNDSCLQLNVSSPLQAEALVVRADLLSAKALGLSSYLSQIKLLSDTLNNQIKTDPQEISRFFTPPDNQD